MLTFIMTKRFFISTRLLLLLLLCFPPLVIQSLVAEPTLQLLLDISLRYFRLALIKGVVIDRPLNPNGLSYALD